jgi:hypothetical protein
MHPVDLDLCGVGPRPGLLQVEGGSIDAGDAETLLREEDSEPARPATEAEDVAAPAVSPT